MSRRDLDSKQFDLRPRGQSRMADEIRDAVGAGPDERVVVRTPQFSRPKGWPEPGGPPRTDEQWDALNTMSRDALEEMGLGCWDGRLMLFPAEWYHRIPDGFVVTTINGAIKAFQRGVTDDDTRFGLLAYGVVAAQEAGAAGEKA